MYQVKRIQDALQHLVGWPQSYDPANAILPALTESESGLTFAQHPLLTLDNIAAIIPDQFALQYPEWGLENVYMDGDKVRQGGKVYISAADNNTGHSPSTEQAWWSDYNVLSDYLLDATRSGIATMVQKFVADKMNRGETRNLLERRPLFDGAGNIRATIKNTGRVVGYEITPIRGQGVTMRVQRVGLQMYGARGAVKLYVFHSSNPLPHWERTCEITADNGAFQWFDTPDLVLPYTSDSNNSGGSWYLCYEQDALPTAMEAVNIARDWSKQPCGSCNHGEVQRWRQISENMEIHPFKVRADFSGGAMLWPVEDMIYTYETSYGLNLEISIDCDITDFIIRQRSAFADVLAKQVCATMLRTMAMNPSANVNRHQLNVNRTDILYELDGSKDSATRGGLGVDLQAAYKALYIDTTGMDRVCLPCNNHGVRSRTIM